MAEDEVTLRRLLPERHARSVVEMHAAARWILSAAGGIGALSQLGGLDPRPLGTDGNIGGQVALAVAVGAVLPAIMAVWRIIRAAARVFTTTYPGFDAFVDEIVEADKTAQKKRDGAPPPGTPPGWTLDPALKRAVQAAKTYLLPVGSEPSEVYAAQERMTDGMRRLREGRAEVTVQGRVYTSSEQLHAELDQVHQAIAAALSAADEQRVKDAFGGLVATLRRAGGVVVMAVLAFVVAVALAPKPVKVTKPVPVLVEFGSGVTPANLGLGDKCKIPPAGLYGVAVEGTFERPVVVLASQGECRARRLVIEEDVGVAVPQVAKPSG
jgi:hypothetical protein